MALILYSTANKTTANAYIDQAYMTAYLADRIGSTAVTAYNASAEKDALIMLATQRIDYFNFVGDRADASQRLKFPRSNIIYDDYEMNDTTIPDGIERATAEMVLFLVENSIDTVNEDINYSSATVGPISVTYKDSQMASPANVSLNPIIKGLLAPFLPIAGRALRG